MNIYSKLNISRGGEGKNQGHIMRKEDWENLTLIRHTDSKRNWEKQQGSYSVIVCEQVTEQRQKWIVKIKPRLSTPWKNLVYKRICGRKNKK